MRDLAQTIRIRQEVADLFKNISTVRAIVVKPQGGKG